MSQIRLYFSFLNEDFSPHYEPYYQLYLFFDHTIELFPHQQI